MDFPDGSMPAEPTRLRILQHRGRRYAIRMEPTYWRVLQDAAAEFGCRLNHLVGGIATAGSGNLTARLRLFCVRRLGRQLVEAKAAAGGTDMASIVRACPSPCLLITEARVVAFCNRPLEALFGLEAGQLDGRPFEHFFRFGLGRPLAEALQVAAVQSGHLTYMMPGRVVGLRATVCPVAERDPGGRHHLIFVIPPAGGGRPTAATSGSA
ncbi:MAG TPA: ribbon-helix-helix domain-containing protein [Alphaproteobacteria bacterium]|nr:ribbon-helix-helix domain-containing protein [Alphaproteobacteria bacterium]